MSRAHLEAASRALQPLEATVRIELARILSSEIFSRSDRLSAFLTFIVERTLDGHGDALKEHVLAIELYGKHTDFNAAADPIVRVDARRLRDKLREFYASAAHGPIVISVPKGSYTPVFEAVPIKALQPAVVDLEPPGRLTRPWKIRALAVLLLAAVGWLAFGIVTRERSNELRLLTVTSYPGGEGMPSFSPDGNFIVFIWSGPVSPGINDLWVKAVEGDGLRRLTDTPRLHEAMPAWSPDGQQIAFFRIETGAGRLEKGVFLISPLGGPERKVSDTGGSPAWTPDSRSLVLNDRAGDDGTGVAIFQQVLETGVRRQLTSPPSGFSDMFPIVSPDGLTVAFARSSTNLNQAAVFIVPLTGGDPTRLSDWSEGVVGRLGWTPDGREILYPRLDTSGLRVFRISASGRGPGRIVQGLPFGVNMLSVSHLRADRTFRVALGYGQPDVGLRLIDLQPAPAGRPIATPTPFCDATRIDTPGRFSRDGSRVAFASDRSGNQQVWVAARDESGLRAVTDLHGSSVNVGSWSPDGHRVAFDAVVAGNADLYVVSADGGPVRRLTDRAASDTDAEWSRDGQWIYFTSNASGRSEIWKLPAAGGTPVELTFHGGLEPREASDGQTIYYVEGARSNGLSRVATLKQVPVASGPEVAVHTGVRPGAWDITDTGVVFVTGDPGPMPATNVADALDFYDFADRRVRRVGDLPFAVSRFGVSRVLIASRDGRWVVASHIDSWERDILVADHFR